MSAESFLLYYGIRLPVREEEIKQLEWETHPSMAAAERYGLDTWWGNFSPDGGEEYHLFIGKQLAMLGGEYADCRSLTIQEVHAISETVAAQLTAAGFQEVPALWAQWEPDY